MAGPFGGLQPEMSFVARLRAACATITPSDPWSDTLRSVKGKIGTDKVHRIATDAIFDVLDLPRFQRTPETGKRIKKIMLKLGWTPVRSRHVTSRGRAARVRGYARLGKLASEAVAKPASTLPSEATTLRPTEAVFDVLDLPPLQLTPKAATAPGGVTSSRHVTSRGRAAWVVRAF